jgi:hypothetical protein
MERLKEYVELQKKFAEMYHSGGLVGISDTYVQLTEKEFAELLTGHPVTTEWCGMALQLSAIYEGTKFITLVN